MASCASTNAVSAGIRKKYGESVSEEELQRIRSCRCDCRPRPWRRIAASPLLW